MLTYFMYCRKSSEDEERQIISIESQRDELTPIIKRDGLCMLDQIEEDGSAKRSGTRPRFNDMVRRIRKGEANAILCWHVNRLSRNAGDAATLVELMDQGRLTEIRTPTQVFKNIPSDKFLIILFCGQAKLENDNKGVDVARGLRKKADLGWYPGVAPMGFLNDRTKLRGERDLYKDPDRFTPVKRMWQMVLTGLHTPPQILEIANNQWGFRTRQTRKQGGNPLSLSALYHIFHNPFYYGWYEYPKGSGNWYEGRHEPMVTKAEFDRVQTLLRRNGNSRPSKHFTFSYTGLIRCGECGGMVTAEEKHNLRCNVCKCKFVYRNRDKCPRCATRIADMAKPVFRDYAYYHCARRKTKCRQAGIEVDDLEAQIAAQLQRIEISRQFKDWAFENLKQIHREDLNAAKHGNQFRDKVYADCLKRLENLVKLKTAAGNAGGALLSDEEYLNQRQALLAEKAALEKPSETPRARAERALQESKAAFEFAESAYRKFVKDNPKAKKQILAGMGSHQTLIDKRLIIEARKPFVWLGDFLVQATSENAPIAPENNLGKQGRKRPIEPYISSQLRDVKDVRTNTAKIRRMARKIYHYYRDVQNDPGN